MSGGVVERKIKTLIFARVWWCIGCSYWCQLLADAVNVGGRGGDVDQGPVGMVKYAWVLMLHRMPAVSLAGCGWNWCGDEEVRWFECVVEITVSDRLLLHPHGWCCTRAWCSQHLPGLMERLLVAAVACQ